MSTPVVDKGDAPVARKDLADVPLAPPYGGGGLHDVFKRRYLLKLLVQKDRPGGVRGHAVGDVVAIVTITPSRRGDVVRVRLDPPAEDAGEFRPTALMERASQYIVANPGQSKNSVVKGCAGNRNALLKAISLLVDDGYVEVRGGKHYHTKPYEDEELAGAGAVGTT